MIAQARPSKSAGLTGSAFQHGSNRTSTAYPAYSAGLMASPNSAPSISCEGAIMEHRPITFDAPSVRAILAGQKTQTQRVATHIDESSYGQPGHTLWVREDALELGCWEGEGSAIWSTAGTVHYLADGNPPAAPAGLIWKEVPASDLRRKHSRITLEIVSVQIARYERWEWVIEFRVMKGGAA